MEEFNKLIAEHIPSPELKDGPIELIDDLGYVRFGKTNQTKWGDFEWYSEFAADTKIIYQGRWKRGGISNEYLLDVDRIIHDSKAGRRVLPGSPGKLWMGAGTVDGIRLRPISVELDRDPGIVIIRAYK